MSSSSWTRAAGPDAVVSAGVKRVEAGVDRVEAGVDWIEAGVDKVVAGVAAGVDAGVDACVAAGVEVDFEVVEAEVVEAEVDAEVEEVAGEAGVFFSRSSALKIIRFWGLCKFAWILVLNTNKHGTNNCF